VLAAEVAATDSSRQHNALQVGAASAVVHGLHL
jgi:hypothetical protein